MATVAFVMRPDRARVVEIASSTVAWLREVGHDVRMSPDDADRLELPELAWPEEELGAGTDVAVSLGGDGTMLRTVSLVARAGVPVIGVNFGQLGYLTQIEPDELREALERFFADEHSIEERMMLSVRTEGPADRDRGPHAPAVDLVALNEAVIEKTYGGRTVRLDVSFDGAPFTPYTADGLIVATPTGSTAYALSARGPIIAPTHRAMLLTPVSPHMLFDRSLVLEPDDVLRIEVAGERSATLAVDGVIVAELEPGDAVVCTAAAQPAQLVTFGPRDFHRILKHKFGLADR